MKPTDALGPRDRIWPNSLKVLYTSKDNYSWSLASMRWRDDPDSDYDDPSSWRDAIGIRWNGITADDNDKGNPRSRGHGVWFILPEPVALLAQAFAHAVGLVHGEAAAAE